MPTTQSLTLIAENSLIRSNFNKEEKSKLWKEYGFDKKMNFSWDNEDYRQAVINPDIENAIPKEEDFLPYPFRHLSATTVGGGTWKATEFPEKVLKASASKLSFKPVYVNHNLEVGNIVAGIGKTKWTPGFTAADGTKVPGGIDGPIFVDGKLHPDLCRKLSAFPVPHIQSVSVTVVFEWEPSHTFENREGVEDLWLFEMRIGQMVDGEMVRRVATKIIEYYETSLVWLGADPFAKILDADGNPLNIEKSAIISNSKFDKDPLVDIYKDQGRYFISESCISNDNKLDLVKRIFQKNAKSGKQGFSKQKNKISNNNNNMEDQIINYLAQRLNVKPEEITEDFLKGLAIVPSTEHTSLTALKSKVGSIEDYDKIIGERDKFKEDLEAEQGVVEANKPLVEFATSKLESGKESALKYYRLTLKGKEEDPKVVQLIERAVTENDFETLETLTKQYGGSAISNLEASCQACGSKDVSFRTTEETDGEGKGNEEHFMPDLPGEFRK